MTDDEPTSEPETDRDQSRQEALGLACVVGAAAFVLSGWATTAGATRAARLADAGPEGWEVIETAATGGVASSFATTAAAPALLVVGYLVVMLGPGRWIGPLGTMALRAVRVVGAVVLAASVIAVVAVARRGSMLDVFLPVQPDGTQDRDGIVTFLDRTGTALPFVAAGLVASGATWLAHRALTELPFVGPEDEAEPH
ncbi:hypothetical protein PO878_12200 [Iamia majanohamensis]|uniref:Uncharacterized protein n=1 Tax=Iamia majanohamensis TaxID=467976 RepID=A0AAE9YCG8_9ACTN|nr:hypothetical protein [Iamia majanohamensis]WCO65261.1 hypothetical protein PO878_12200 [Iamia majanohamensis]